VCACVCAHARSCCMLPHLLYISVALPTHNAQTCLLACTPCSPTCCASTLPRMGIHATQRDTRTHGLAHAHAQCSAPPAAHPHCPALALGWAAQQARWPHQSSGGTQPGCGWRTAGTRTHGHMNGPHWVNEWECMCARMRASVHVSVRMCKCVCPSTCA